MLPPSSNLIEPGSFLTQVMRVSNVSKVSLILKLILDVVYIFNLFIAVVNKYYP